MIPGFKFISHKVLKPTGSFFARVFVGIFTRIKAVKLKTWVILTFTIFSISALGIVSYKEYWRYKPKSARAKRQTTAQNTAQRRQSQMDRFINQSQNYALSTMKQCFPIKIFDYLG